MKYCKNNDRGVALLLALGVLSLLLATGIAFVSNAMLAQKSAASYRFRTQSQLLGRSAIQRVMMLMRYYLQAGDLSNMVNLKSTLNDEFFQGDDVPTAGKNDGLSTADDKNLLSAKIDGTDRNASGTEQWEYLWDKYNAGKRSADAKLLGRFAYRVLPALGSVNFSEVLRGNTDASFSSNSMSNWTKRRGFGIRELNLSGCNLQENSLNDRFSGESGIVANDLRKQDSSRALDYASYQNLFNQAPSTLGAAQRKFIRDYLPLGGTEEEVYIYSPTYDKTTFKPNATSEYTRYHRFDLTRQDWNALGGKTANSKEAVHLLLGLNDAGNADIALSERTASEEIKETTTKTADSIPALRRIHDTKGAYPDLQTRRKQIAANLIDYCDTDNIPTSDSNDWTGTAPTYTGNEKTPYINEIMVGPSIAVCREQTGYNEDTKQYTYTYKATASFRMIAVELINLLEKTFPNPKVAMSGSVTLKITPYHGGTAESNKLEAKEATIHFTFTGTNEQTWKLNEHYARSILYTYSSESSPEITPATLTWPPITCSQMNGVKVKADVEITELAINKVHLKINCGGSNFDGTNADYVNSLSFASTLTDTKTASFLTGGYDRVTLYPHVGCEVDDPRENLYQGDKPDEPNASVGKMNWRLIQMESQSKLWALNSSPEDITGDDAGKNALRGTTFSFKEQNKFCHPENSEEAVEKDFETATTPEGVSSVYTNRDNPMQTLVELGAIPRAAKWQTLNLQKSARTPKDDPLSDITAAGDTYTQGDAGILDQVKLTPRVQVPHRLYINDPPGTGDAATVLYGGLFRGLVWNWDKHYNYTCSGSAITDPASPGNILAASGRDRFFSRAELINYTSGSNKLFNAYGTVSPTTDAQRETIPALVSSLISFFPCSPDPLAVLLTAQSIRDIGTTSGFVVHKLRSDGSGNEDSTTVKSGQFDMDSNTYFDEITGTSRFYVEISTDVTKKQVKPLRIEPLD